jgi:hypothetical protein
VVKKFIKLSIIGSIILSNTLNANDGFEEEDEFDNEEIQIVKIQTKEERHIATYGSISFSTNYGYKNNNEIKSAKISADLNLDYKINQNYKIKSTVKAYKDFETEIKDDQEIDINEIYIQGSVSNNVDIKIGRQIVVWGKSDNIRISDNINPMDYTTPGMVDIEDLRLGKMISKVDYFLDKWSISGMLLHENRFSEMAKKGSDYYLGIAPDEPSDSIDNTGIALNVNGNLEGEDIGFYYLNQFVDNTNYRSNMLAIAYNKVLNSFLFKTEVAYFDNYDSEVVDAKTDSLVGLECSISFEVANKNDDIQYALRFTKSYINQTLDLTALYSGFGKELEDGGFIRVWLDYDIDDKLSTNFGVINYQGGDAKRFEKIKDNDRVFASLKYSF